jgi:hypothetical protein
MKHKLPILSAMLLGIVGAVVAGVMNAHSTKVQRAGGDAPPFGPSSAAMTAPPQGVVLASAEAPLPAASPAPVIAAAPNLTPAPAAPGVSQAADLVRRSIDQLALYETLSAKIRFHGNLLGHSLGGTGQYLQSGHAPIRLRMELKMSVGDDTCTLQQVCDGNALWIRRTTPGSVRLGHVDVARVMAARQARLATAPPAPGSPTKELAIGGLPLLVDGVRRSFDLQTVQPAMVGNKVSAHKISGMLNAAMLAQLLPEQKPPPAPGLPPDLKKLPVQAPTHVEVYIGVDDLFPYKLDFKRIVDGKTSLDDAESMYSVEFYDVQRNIALDPVQFVYQPGEIAPTDDTDVFISRQ